MFNGISNPALLNLHTLVVNNSDSHAQPGTHACVSHHPWLGLPAMPFVLERATVHLKEIENVELRTDASFRSILGFEF